MTDQDLLLSAVLAAPDDDLPRLVYADRIEETGDADFAGFIREQVAVAAAQPWEPIAVRAAYFRPELLSGSPWFDRLPNVESMGGTSLNWHPERAFHRGFPSGLDVRFPPALLEADWLFRVAPIDHLWLHAGTLDNWQKFALAEFLPRIRGLHFAGLRTPVESVTELVRSERTTGVREMTFTQADGPGFPDVLRRVMDSDIAANLESLELRMGPEDSNDFLQILDDNLARLTRLTLTHFNLRETFLNWHLNYLPFEKLTHLDLSGNRIGSINGRSLGNLLALAPNLASLCLSGCDFDAGHCKRMIAQLPAGVLRRLDLSENPLGSDGIGGFVREAAVTGLRSLRLAQTGIEASGLFSLVRGPFWPKLVELDLRQNRLTADGLRPLLDAVVPAELTALDLRGNVLDPATVDSLRERYGSAVLTDL